MASLASIDHRAEAEPRVDAPHEREVAGVVTRALVSYLRQRQGEPGVRSLLEIAGESRDVSALEDERGGSYLGAVLALFRAAELLTGDPGVARRVGERQLTAELAARGRLRIGVMGSPARVLRRAVALQAGWWGAVHVDVHDAGRAGARVQLRMREGHDASLHVCLHTQGVLRQVTAPFRLPPASVSHARCQLRGAAACSYELTWPAWWPVTSHLLRGPRHRSVAAALELLQERIAELESTVAELVSTDDLDEALARIAARAGAAVRGQRFVLMVQLPDDPAPRLHSAGFARDEATRLAEELALTAPDVVPEADRVVAEVASARRHYGWLAAYPRPGTAVHPTDHAQLDAYARLAAAALDAATALADARRGDRTARAVLGLARELGAEPDEAALSQRIVEAVTTAVGSHRASLLLLDDDEDVLRTVAVHGFGERTSEALAFEVSLATAPALAVTLTDPTARLYTADDPDAWVRELTTSAGAAALAVAPMIGREGLIGLLVANWSDAVPMSLEREPILHGLTGLADHAGVTFAGLRSQEQGRRRRSFDAVTELADQATFDERVALHLADRRRGSSLTAVCTIDLDGLPDIDDSLWGPGANPVLVELAARVRNRLRETDGVARVGPRELAILLCDLTERGNAEQVAIDLAAALGAPVRVDEHTFVVDATVGIAFAGQHGSSTGELLASARTAMREAKADEVVYRIWHPPTSLPGL